MSFIINNNVEQRFGYLAATEVTTNSGPIFHGLSQVWWSNFYESKSLSFSTEQNISFSFIKL